VGPFATHQFVRYAGAMSGAGARVQDAGRGPAAATPTAAPEGPARVVAADPLSSAPGVLALQRSAGNRAVGAVLRARGPSPRRALHRLGYRLDKPLPSGAEKPKHGSDADQRRYSIDQFTKMWEAQFHALSSSEADNVLRGCVGITALNLGLGPLVAPTDLPSNKVYGTFAQARAIAAAKNDALGTIAPGSPIQGYVVYAMLFWSNRDPDDKKRGKPDPKAFRPDPKTGEVDMSKIGDIYALSRPPDYTNFDFGFWDESTQTFWHANHGTYTGMKTPEEIYQSTHARFARKYWENGEEHVSYPDFDRVVYGVASTNVKPEKLLLPTRDEKIAAFKARVAAGDWADAALRLNGFDTDDIKRLGRMITHDERSAIMGAAYGAMPGWSDRVVDNLTEVDKEPPPPKPKPKPRRP
jgi:hypothetical protein